MRPADPTPLYLVAVDGSAPSGEAAAYAFELAAQTRARLRVVTVQDIGLLHAEAVAASGFQTFVPGYDEIARDAIAKATAHATRLGASAEFVVLPLGEPAAAIVRDAAACGASLIIVGSHGRTGISRALVGSVAERVVRHAPCPVLVVRR
jgi:nucleotide-binding universal stress UspA family protein